MMARSHCTVALVLVVLAMTHGAWAVDGDEEENVAQAQEGDVVGTTRDDRPAMKPNILLLFPDEWRFDWDSFHDDPTGPIPLNLPFLRSLAARGTRFTSAYVPAPLCAPSRSCLASGREYDHANVPSNTANDYPISQKTFYSVLRDEAGYWTMAAGKDDLTKASEIGYRDGHKQAAADGSFHLSQLGFCDALRHAGKGDVVVKYPVAYERYGLYLQNQTVMLRNGTRLTAWESHYACYHMKGNGGVDEPLCDEGTFPDIHYEDNFVSREAITLLKRKPKGRPWFLQVNFPGPHPPFLVTAAMAESVTSRTWPDPTDGPPLPCPQQQPNHSINVMSAAVADGGRRVKGVADRAPANGGRCNYGAEIENIDGLFQGIVDVISDLGELNNTLVCVSSDHGDMLGDHGDEEKSKPWQGSAAVPLICAGPGVARGVVVSSSVTNMDLAGTFLDFAGAKPAAGMTTRSLKPLLQGWRGGTGNEDAVGGGRTTSRVDDAPSSHSSNPRVFLGGRPFVSSGLDNWRMVIQDVNSTTSYKLVCCKGECPGAPSNVPPPEDGWTLLLYNTRLDPFDTQPLAGALPEVVRSMIPFLPSGWCGSD